MFVHYGMSPDPLLRCPGPHLHSHTGGRGVGSGQGRCSEHQVDDRARDIRWIPIVCCTGSVLVTVPELPRVTCLVGSNSCPVCKHRSQSRLDYVQLGYVMKMRVIYRLL